MNSQNGHKSGLTQVWGLGAKRREVEGGILLEYEQVGSTMDAARERVRAGETEIVGVRAEYQSAGRGRRGGVWLAPPGGCLLITYILSVGPTLEARHLAFAAAVAVAEAVEAETDIPARVKWPNDILAGGRKLAGILIEMVGLDERPTTNDQRRVPELETSFPNAQHLTPNASSPTPYPLHPTPAVALVGIGLNVNINAFPPELGATATSVEVESGLLFDISELEEKIRISLFETVGLPWPEILSRWRSRDVTEGTRFLTTIDGEEIEGVARGTTDEGALILQTNRGRVETLAATSVVSS
jgi:BirA family biotin operon repressor/biotin-[acetyl-CoA-carboxylase] ligase